jgi:hypothetical protein
VDWLAWEDPFIMGRNPSMLKTERENGVQEFEARLSYCLPMVEAMLRFAQSQRWQ